MEGNDAHSINIVIQAGGVSSALPAGACHVESSAHWQAQHIVQAPQGWLSCALCQASRQAVKL